MQTAHLIKEQDGGVLDECACDGDALLLAARQLYAALSQLHQDTASVT